MAAWMPCSRASTAPRIGPHANRRRIASRARNTTAVHTVVPRFTLKSGVVPAPPCATATPGRVSSRVAAAAPTRLILITISIRLRVLPHASCDAGRRLELQEREAESEERHTLDEGRQDDGGGLDVARRFRLPRDARGHLRADLTDADAGADHGEADGESGAHEAEATLSDSVLNSLGHEKHDLDPRTLLRCKARSADAVENELREPRELPNLNARGE